MFSCPVPSLDYTCTVSHFQEKCSYGEHSLIGTWLSVSCIYLAGIWSMCGNKFLLYRDYLRLISFYPVFSNIDFWNMYLLMDTCCGRKGGILVPQHACSRQTATLWSWLSPHTLTWVAGLNSGCPMLNHLATLDVSFLFFFIEDLIFVTLKNCIFISLCDSAFVPLTLSQGQHVWPCSVPLHPI